jgi:hypothetical protein
MVAAPTSNVLARRRRRVVEVIGISRCGKDDRVLLKLCEFELPLCPCDYGAVVKARNSIPIVALI